MAQLLINPTLADYLAGSILSLVLPLAVLIAVTIWYVAVWRKHDGASAELDKADARRVSADTRS
jgi:hypothetical protein